MRIHTVASHLQTRRKRGQHTQSLFQLGHRRLVKMLRTATRPATPRLSDLQIEHIWILHLGLLQLGLLVSCSSCVLEALGDLHDEHRCSD